MNALKVIWGIVGVLVILLLVLSSFARLETINSEAQKQALVSAKVEADFLAACDGVVYPPPVVVQHNLTVRWTDEGAYIDSAWTTPLPTSTQGVIHLFLVEEDGR